MDISNLQVSDKVIEIVHPKTHENIGIRIELCSIEANDDAVKTIKRKFLDRRNWFAARQQQMPGAEQMKWDIDILFAAMKSWDWYDADIDGVKPKFTREEVGRVFEKFPWMRQQVQTVVNSVEDFISA